MTGRKCEGNFLSRQRRKEDPNQGEEKLKGAFSRKGLGTNHEKWLSRFMCFPKQCKIGVSDGNEVLGGWWGKILELEIISFVEGNLKSGNEKSSELEERRGFTGLKQETKRTGNEMGMELHLMQFATKFPEMFKFQDESY